MDVTEGWVAQRVQGEKGGDLKKGEGVGGVGPGDYELVMGRARRGSILTIIKRRGCYGGAMSIQRHTKCG